MYKNKVSDKPWHPNNSYCYLRWTSVPFVSIVDLLIAALVYGYFLINAYKIYGQQIQLDDTFLTIVGSVGALFCSLFRFVWAWLIDMYTFKSVYGVLLVLQFFVTSTLYWVSGNPHLFFVWYCLSSICYGGHFSITPAACANIFGLKM